MMCSNVEKTRFYTFYPRASFAYFIYALRLANKIVLLALAAIPKLQILMRSIKTFLHMTK